MQLTHLKNPIVAHRGAWLEFDLPENSVASLKKAIEIGVGATEFDVHMTLDDVLVVHHDSDYFGLPIEKTLYTDLQKHVLPNNETLPTVAQFLEIGLKQKQTKLVFEIKSSVLSDARTLQIVDKVVTLVKSNAYSDRLEFIMFSWEGAQYLKKQLPAYKVSYLNGDKTPEQIALANLDGIDYHITTFKKFPNYISECKARNLLLNSWTVNYPEDIIFLLDEKFDMITTNKPLEFLKLYLDRK